MSPRAACRLEQLGFTDVSDYAGGEKGGGGGALPTEGSVADDERIGALARPVAPTCDVSTPVGQLRDRVRTAGGTFAIVLADRDVVVGVVALDRLPAQAATTAGDVMDPGPSTFR